MWPVEVSEARNKGSRGPGGCGTISLAAAKAADSTRRGASRTSEERTMNSQPSFCVPDHQKKQPDPILGLSGSCALDPNPDKIDACVGVYRDSDGRTFTPEAVRKAREILDHGTGDYIGPSGEEEYLGDREYLEETTRLAFGRHADDILSRRRLAAIGTPGGTCAVAMMEDTLKALSPGEPILVGVPTWPNHIAIATARDIPVLTYSHMSDNKYDIEAHLEAIKRSPLHSLVIFHTGRPHNPTGVNPSTEAEWRELARAMEGRRAFFDAPYAGLDRGLGPDTEPVRIFYEEGVPLSVAVSYAKNGGIYKERAGALLCPLSTTEEAIELQRLLNHHARVVYSSPPAFGERLMATVLSSPELFDLWNRELQEAAADLKRRRSAFVEEVPSFDFVVEQAGLFSMLPLEAEQVKRLQTEYAVYMPLNGRVNFGGIPPKDIVRFAQAVKAVL
jgi:aspartate/tyrosine/aromatic aminotransferase